MEKRKVSIFFPCWNSNFKIIANPFLYSYCNTSVIYNICYFSTWLSTRLCWLCKRWPLCSLTAAAKSHSYIKEEHSTCPQDRWGYPGPGHAAACVLLRLSDQWAHASFSNTHDSHVSLSKCYHLQWTLYRAQYDIDTIMAKKKPWKTFYFGFNHHKISK